MERLQRVVVEGQASTSVRVASGVPQGTVLGPLLFLSFINDLPDHVQSTVRLFADDCLLYRSIKSPEDQAILQRDLTALESWAQTWGMAFNAKKCYVLCVTRSRNPLNQFYQLNGHILQQVDNSAYLGVTISDNLKWGTHINNITSKANRTLGFLWRNLKSCPQKLREVAYFALVRSTLEYACAIWDPYYIKDVKKIYMVQRRGARKGNE